MRDRYCTCPPAETTDDILKDADSWLDDDCPRCGLREYPLKDWGPWRLYDGESPALVQVEYDYTVDLAQCLSSAEVLDWIAQIAGKEWGHDSVGGLVNALDDVFHLQGSMCGSGVAKPRLSINRAEIGSRLLTDDMPRIGEDQPRSTRFQR